MATIEAVWPFILIGVFVSGSQAPVSNLRVNGDGSLVWFSSLNRMVGAEQPWPEKIFSLDEGGPRLVFGDPGAGAMLHEQRGNARITVTRPACPLNSACVWFPDPHLATVEFAGRDAVQHRGRGTLSGNGR